MYMVDEYSSYAFNLFDTYFRNYFTEAQGIFIYRLSLTMLPTRNASSIHWPPPNVGRKSGAKGRWGLADPHDRRHVKRATTPLPQALEPGSEGKPSQRD